jgi:hypothetical protein
MSTLTPATIDRLVQLNQVGKIEKLPNGKVGFIVPEGMHLIEVGEHDPKLPCNIQTDVKLHDEYSFKSYINRFKNNETTVFAAPGFLAAGRGAYFAAAVDYHGESEVNRNEHHVNYHPRYSDEWKLWTAGHSFDQEGFAEFIEENRKDVKEPAAGVLLDLIRNFKATRKIQYDKAFHEKDGSVKLTYEDETDAQGEIVVPDMMKVGIPVYFNGPAYALQLFMRYRVGSGKVSFGLKPDRQDIIEYDAFQEMAVRIKDECEVPVYLGEFQDNRKDGTTVSRRSRRNDD